MPLPSSSGRPNKSTNVRAPIPWMVSAPVAQAIGPWAPERAAFVLQWAFSTPRKYQRPEREAELLRTGRRFDVIAPKGTRIRATKWGTGPTVLLMHGWEGRGAQLGSFVPTLVEAGYEVVTFDAPAHGDSGGSVATPLEFAHAAQAVASWNGRAVHGIVAHSMGAIAAALAVRGGLAVDRCVLVSPGTSPAEAIEGVAARLKLSAPVVEALQGRLGAHLGLTWDAFSSGHLYRDFSPDTLVVHDVHDADVPLEDARNVAEKAGAKWVQTEGLGHRRILRDAEVVATVTSFFGPAPVQQGGWGAFLREVEVMG